MYLTIVVIVVALTVLAALGLFVWTYGKTNGARGPRPPRTS